MNFLNLFSRWRSSKKQVQIDPELQEFIDAKIMESQAKVLSQVSAVIRGSIDETEVDQSVQVDSLIKTIHENVKLNHDLVSDFKKSVDERINENSEMVNALVDAVSERAKRGEDLHETLKSDRCPFGVINGTCSVWKNRPAKNDAPNYCTPCMMRKMLKERGIR